MGPAVITIIIVNLVVSYQGLKDWSFLNKYSFKTYPILGQKDYKRMITSGFLHVDWTHFFFNMITLYFFGPALEAGMGIAIFLLVYFGSLIGGSLLSLFLNRNSPNYSAVGASGAISGVIFACIAFIPEMGVNLFYVLPVPGWLYGLGYVAYSIYGIQSRKDNIGHEAHLGGGLAGLLISVLIFPERAAMNILPISLILVPSVIFFLLVLYRPDLLMKRNPFAKSQNLYTKDDKFNSGKLKQQIELDALLDKVGKKGYDSLSTKEKQRLKELSDQLT